MNEDELVSIILPVYNGEQFLEETIKSCLEQTYKAVELIVVNDCSTDNTLKIAEEISGRDPRVRIINNKENEKLPASLNTGHRIAKGNLLTWISDDNIFDPSAIEVLVRTIKTTGKDIAYSDFIIIDEEGKFKRQIELGQAGSLLFGNTIGASFIYKKEVYQRNKGYDEDLHTVEDFDFWLQASIHSSFHHIKEMLYKFRSHSRSLSSQVSSDSSIDQQFSERLETAYRKFFRELKISPDSHYSDLFFKLHRYKEVNVQSFFSDYQSFKNTLKLISERSSLFEYGSLLQITDLRIRSNIQHYVANQNINVLFQILRKRPEILLNYDRRNSLKIISKSLKLS